MSKSRTLIIVCYVWTALLILGLLIFGPAQPDVRAAIYMLVGLAVLWVGVFGTLLYVLRKPIKKVVSLLSLGSGVLFFFLALLLALFEEAIAVLMTNLAPLFGVPVGTVAITASTNYFEVVLFHSVVAFIPFFLCWAWLLKKYAFKPWQVMMLVGVLGIIGEFFVNGASALIAAGFWILVYGHMVYLPAYVAGPGEKKPGWFAYALALVLPLFCALVGSFVFQMLFT